MKLREVAHLTDAGQFSLSDVQRETLRVAYESGYYSVPRAAALGELAARLGVSHQAISERLRRGVGSLIEYTLAGGPSNDRREVGTRGRPPSRSEPLEAEPGGSVVVTR
jgi:hypothetical protein